MVNNNYVHWFRFDKTLWNDASCYWLVWGVIASLHHRKWFIFRAAESWAPPILHVKISLWDSSCESSSVEVKSEKITPNDVSRVISAWAWKLHVFNGQPAFQIRCKEFKRRLLGRGGPRVWPKAKSQYISASAQFLTLCLSKVPQLYEVWMTRGVRVGLGTWNI